MSAIDAPVAHAAKRVADTGIQLCDAAVRRDQLEHEWLQQQLASVLGEPRSLLSDQEGQLHRNQ